MTQPQASQANHTVGKRLVDQPGSLQRRHRRKRKRRKLFSSIQDIIWRVAIIPIKLLFAPARLVEMFYFRGHKTGRRRGIRSVRQRVKYSLKEGLRLPYRLISKGFKRRKLKDLLFLLPAVTALEMVCFIGFQLSTQSQQIQDRYNSRARQALLSGNLNLANTYFNRLFDHTSLSASQTLQWVTVLRSAGERERADRILAQLAPDDRQGYPAAHAIRAIELAENFDNQLTTEVRNIEKEIDLDNAWIQSSDSTKVDRATNQLKTHLQNANDDDPRIHLAWGKYWLYQQDIGAACQRIKRAAESPELPVAAAHLIDRSLNAEHLTKQERKQLLNTKFSLLANSRKMLESKLKANPLDHRSRIQLAATMVNQGNINLAKDCLKKGIAFVAAPLLQRGLADILVLEYRSTTLTETALKPQSPDELLRNQINQLKAAIEADPTYVLPYVCLARLLCGQTENDDNTDSPIGKMTTSTNQQAVDAFHWLVTSDHPSAMDHIGLAALHWRQGNRKLADWNLDQAWALEPFVGDKAHRLATACVFFTKTPDLAWAKNLIDRTLVQRPNVPEVLLSHGRILLEQGETELAVQQLNRCLSGAKFPEEVHEALEIGYVKLGNLILADKHARLAKSARARRIIANWQ